MAFMGGFLLCQGRYGGVHFGCFGRLLLQGFGVGSLLGFEIVDCEAAGALCFCGMS